MKDLTMYELQQLNGGSDDDETVEKITDALKATAVGAVAFVGAKAILAVGGMALTPLGGIVVAGLGGAVALGIKKGDPTEPEFPTTGGTGSL